MLHDPVERRPLLTSPAALRSQLLRHILHRPVDHTRRPGKDRQQAADLRLDPVDRGVDQARARTLHHLHPRVIAKVTHHAKQALDLADDPHEIEAGPASARDGPAKDCRRIN